MVVTSCYLLGDDKKRKKYTPKQKSPLGASYLADYHLKRRLPGCLAIPFFYIHTYIYIAHSSLGMFSRYLPGPAGA